SAQDIGKLLKLDKSAAWRRLTKARNEGFVINLEVRKGMQGKYRATQQEVELLSVLPSAEELREKHEEHICRHTPSESTQPCNREEKTLTDDEDDGCTDGCNPVARPLATVKPLKEAEKSVPVARLHANPEGYEISGDLSIPSCLRRCEQCGAPND